MSVKAYLLSVPERLLRAGVGLGAGVVREIGEVTIPLGLRRGQLYQNLVDTTLRFLIEQVGGADGVYPPEEKLAENFLIRRTAGNAIEALGIVAFRASPVWILAALADVCGAGRQLIPEIAEALKKDGLLDGDAPFATMEQLLDGLERTSSRLAATVNTPPLDVPALREEWRAIRAEAASLAPARIPSRESILDVWKQVTAEAARQDRSVFEMSSTLALSAAAAVPARLRWLSASARLAAGRTGQVLGAAMLDHYRQTLQTIRDVGFARYALQQCRPYVRAAASQFSPRRQTLTESALVWWRRK